MRSLSRHLALLPNTLISPESISVVPIIQFNNVVFPIPLGPKRPYLNKSMRFYLCFFSFQFENFQLSSYLHFSSLNVEIQWIKDIGIGTVSLRYVNALDIFISCQWQKLFWVIHFWKTISLIKFYAYLFYVSFRLKFFKI
jgi:hypothetical protein